jgi:hypothetical protein
MSIAKPMSIANTREDVNNMRAHLVSGKAGSISKSPLQDYGFRTGNLEALGLNPGSGSTQSKDINNRLGKKFNDWKTQQAASARPSESGAEHAPLLLFVSRCWCVLVAPVYHCGRYLQVMILDSLCTSLHLPCTPLHAMLASRWNGVTLTPVTSLC